MRKSSETPLHRACRKGNLEKIGKKLQIVKNVPKLLNAKNSNGKTAFDLLFDNLSKRGFNQYIKQFLEIESLDFNNNSEQYFHRLLFYLEGSNSDITILFLNHPSFVIPNMFRKKNLANEKLHEKRMDDVYIKFISNFHGKQEIIDWFLCKEEVDKDLFIYTCFSYDLVILFEKHYNEYINSITKFVDKIKFKFGHLDIYYLLKSSYYSKISNLFLRNVNSRKEIKKDINKFLIKSFQEDSESTFKKLIIYCDDFDYLVYTDINVETSKMEYIYFKSQPFYKHLYQLEWPKQKLLFLKRIDKESKENFSLLPIEIIRFIIKLCYKIRDLNNSSESIKKNYLSIL